MKRIVLFLAIIAALPTPILHAKETLNILSTIKPVHALVRAIAGDLVETHQIIPDYASPHHYSLRPSDLRRLNAADLVFRIDPALESFLNKSLRNISTDKVINLTDTKSLTILAARTPHAHREEHIDQHADEAHHDDHEDAQDEDHNDDEKPVGAIDYHLWLNPDNAILMANTMRDALIEAIPDHKETFAHNTQQLTEEIRKTSKAITQQLEPVKSTPFLVMHDAWQYFTQYYQLNQLGTVSAQQRLKTSAKAIASARKMLMDSNVQCLVAEPNLKQRTLTVLTEGLPVNTTEIDPLGRNPDESGTSYPQLLQYTADKLLNCLQKK
ncbi:MAG: zinc ABC transporter substrate-binding protein [Leucothrix sp.]